MPRDILLPVYVYLLYILDGTVAAWMKSSVFIHLMQLPSNPIIFGFGRLALRCDFSKTKIQPLTFTQMEIEKTEHEKLAFWTHRGLWQFVRMPFGYKNGPSIFQ